MIFTICAFFMTFYLFVSSLWLFIFKEWCKSTSVPDPDPDPLVKGSVRIRTNKSRIRKTALEGSVRKKSHNTAILYSVQSYIFSIPGDQRGTVQESRDRPGPAGRGRRPLPGAGLQPPLRWVRELRPVGHRGDGGAARAGGGRYSSPLLTRPSPLTRHPLLTRPPHPCPPPSHAGWEGLLPAWRRHRQLDRGVQVYKSSIVDEI